MADETDSSISEIGDQESSPVDCSFVIGSGASAITIGAHKSILSRASTVFERMFNGNYKEADASTNIPLPNVSDITDFKIVLDYIYGKKYSLKYLNLKRLKHIAYLADYYWLGKLLTECHDTIVIKAKEEHVSLHDYVQIYEYQRKLRRQITYFKYINDTCIYESAFPYESKELTSNTSIYDLQPVLFYDLLKKIDSKFKEIERFCLIENYGKIHGLKMDGVALNKIEMVDDSPKAHSEDLNSGNTLKQMFHLINFENMTVNEFKMGPAVSELWLVSANEKLRILLSCKRN
ncbi:uncharacterized protein [Eurosta solidaginis]|uniref:uncharacterized protein n=1 Tax=Eurosta solidaginis TaxID=178769 RepID=UPI0035307FEA